MRKPRLWHGLEALLIEKQDRLVIGGGVACFFLLLLLAFVGERGFLEAYRFGQHLTQIESRIQTLEEENERLRRRVIGLQTDPYQVEKLAREDLGLARPDEIIFEIVDGAPEESPSARPRRQE
jgi:cell division protein FtsB